jgi:hypothetical protein
MVMTGKGREEHTPDSDSMAQPGTKSRVTGRVEDELHHPDGLTRLGAPGRERADRRGEIQVVTDLWLIAIPDALEIRPPRVGSAAKCSGQGDRVGVAEALRRQSLPCGSRTCDSNGER